MSWLLVQKPTALVLRFCVFEILSFLVTKIMKKHLLLIILFLSSMFASAQVEKILGEWRTVDDVTGETKGIVEFYQGDNGR